MTENNKEFEEKTDQLLEMVEEVLQGQKALTNQMVDLKQKTNEVHTKLGEHFNKLDEKLDKILLEQKRNSIQSAQAISTEHNKRLTSLEFRVRNLEADIHSQL